MQFARTPRCLRVPPWPRFRIGLGLKLCSCWWYVRSRRHGWPPPAWWPKPHHGARGRAPHKVEASHAAYWHRRTQGRKPDLYLDREGEIIERRIRTQRERFAPVLVVRPPAKILSSHRLRASGWQGASTSWVIRWWRAESELTQRNGCR